MAFAVLFLALWRFYWFDRRNSCQKTGEKVHLPAFKPALRHSLFYFLHFLGYFGSIEGTVDMIRAKTFIRLLRKWFYDIRCFIFSTFEVILSRSKVRLLRYGRIRSFTFFKTSFTTFTVLFLAFW